MDGRPGEEATREPHDDSRRPRARQCERRGGSGSHLRRRRAHAGLRGPGPRREDRAGESVQLTKVFDQAVNQRGAAGALGTGNAGVSGNSPGYSLNEIGWQTVCPKPGGGGFGFVLTSDGYRSSAICSSAGRRSSSRPRSGPGRIRTR